jgi:outer membrane murein-binding lipoprotein Lpp
MTTTRTPTVPAGLTPKQRQVYIRNLRAAGVEVELPDATPVTGSGARGGSMPVAPEPVAVDGVVDPAVALEGAIEQGNARIVRIAAEVSDLQAQIEALTGERTETEERIAKYATALGALT